MSKTTNKYFPEVRERAVRRVLDNAGQHESRWHAIVLISAKIGCSTNTLNDWVKKAEVDRGDGAGVRKVWRQMRREGFDVARCTIARLMKDLGLQGAIRGKPQKTTIPDKKTAVPAGQGEQAIQDVGTEHALGQ